MTEQQRRAQASAAGAGSRIALVVAALAAVGFGAWWYGRGPAAESPPPVPQVAASQATHEAVPVAPSGSASVGAPALPGAEAKLAEKSGVASQRTAAGASRSTFSFDTAPDLYKVASDSINSSDPGVLFNGLDAVNICTVWATNRNSYEQLAAASQTPQALAAKEMLSRCGGFFANDFSANDGLRKRYLQRLKGSEGQYLHRGTFQNPLDEKFAALIATQDWQMFVAYMAEVMPGALKAQGIAPNSEQAMFFGAAWMQATCDMERDCSGRGAMYLAGCANSGRCAGSVEAEMSEGMSEHQKKMVKQFRDQISAAIINKDLGFFGLGRVN